MTFASCPPCGFSYLLWLAGSQRSSFHPWPVSYHLFFISQPAHILSQLAHKPQPQLSTGSSGPPNLLHTRDFHSPSGASYWQPFCLLLSPHAGPWPSHILLQHANQSPPSAFYPPVFKQQALLDSHGSAGSALLSFPPPFFFYFGVLCVKLDQTAFHTGPTAVLGGT